MPLPPLKDGAVPSQSTANALPCPYRPSMGAPGVAGEGHPTGNTESRKKLYLPRPPAASFSLLSSSNSTSPTHTLVNASTRKSLLIHSIKELLPPALLLHPKHAPGGNFHAGIALSCSPPTSRAHTRGDSNTPAFYRAKGFSLCLPLPAAMEHIPDPASRGQGMQTPSPALLTPCYSRLPPALLLRPVLKQSC